MNEREIEGLRKQVKQIRPELIKSKKEQIKKLKEKIEIPLDSYQRLKYSWDMILCVEDFINCIGLHKADLKSPRNIGLMNFNKDILNNKGFNPAGVLKDYIYLEANSFFEFVKILRLTKGYNNLPELPNYFKELKNFRNVMVGHRDKKEISKFPEGWIELQEQTQKLIPVKKLIKDVDDYFNCLKSIEKSVYGIEQT